MSVSGCEAEAGGTHAEREKDPASHQLPLSSQFRVSLQGEPIVSGIERRKRTCRITVTYTWSLSLCREARCSRICEGLASLGIGIGRAADLEKMPHYLQKKNLLLGKDCRPLCSPFVTVLNRIETFSSILFHFFLDRTHCLKRYCFMKQDEAL